MKKTAWCLVAAIAFAAPAYAQLGGLGKLKKAADQAKKISDLRNISEKDERTLGENISLQLMNELGVYQDAAVTKYVSLVGTVLAQASTRPNLQWQFVVLDTDGVNAYAAPGGIVHITRGALATMKTEAELAGVLAHEITHVTEKHTVNAIQKSKRLDFGSDMVTPQGGLLANALNELADMGTQILLFNKLDRDDELESDKVGVQLANKVGYAPGGLTSFLNQLVERNTGREEPNGLFASHPQLKERIEKNDRTVRDGRLTASALVQARYASSVKVTAKPLASIALATTGVRGAAADSPATASNTTTKPEEKKEDPPAKKKGGLAGLAGRLSGGSQVEQTQASASAGGRMAGPDTLAAGGPNKNPVRVTLSQAEIDAFKKGIA